MKKKKKQQPSFSNITTFKCGKELRAAQSRVLSHNSVMPKAPEAIHHQDRLSCP